MVLSKELKSKKSGVVGLSTVTDPYQPIEEKYRLTRYCLEQLLRYDFPVHIQTKSDMVVRDIDLISKFSDIEVMFSIGTLSDSERKYLEPNASPIKNRLDAMRKISDTGIKTSVFFGPIYPTVKLNDIPEIIDAFMQHGANEIMVDKLNLKPGIIENLDYIFEGKPGILSKILGNDDYYKEIRQRISKHCDKNKIKYIDAF